MTFDRTTYNREWARAKRANEPPSKIGQARAEIARLTPLTEDGARYKLALQLIASELSDSNTEKGKRLRDAALSALGHEK